MIDGDFKKVEKLFGTFLKKAMDKSDLRFIGGGNDKSPSKLTAKQIMNRDKNLGKKGLDHLPPKT